jgi:acyl-CoA thioester hydrolase
MALQESGSNLGRVRTTFRVRYAETDQMGIVYHANYLIWMEIGRVEFVRARGWAYKQIEGEGLFLAVVEANCRYLFPARYDELIAVDTAIERSSSRVVEFAYDIRLCETEQLLAKGKTRHVWLNREMRPCSLPPEYMDSVRVTVPPSEGDPEPLE